MTEKRGDSIMTTRHFRFFRNAVLALIPAMALPVPAFADLCRNPDVKVINEKSIAMEVRQIGYFDVCNNVWRTEDVPNTEILPGAFHTFHDDLEYVEGCAISQFKLYRRVFGSTGWTSVIWGNPLIPTEGQAVECVAGANYTLRNP
jgi:hypothetical protein